jgi:hypothetical protein
MERSGLLSGAEPALETALLRRSYGSPLDGWSWLHKNRCMKRIPQTLSLALFLFAGSTLGCATPEPSPVAAPEGQIYRWTDTEGKTHFTPSLEQLPPTIREQISILASMPGESRMALSKEGRWAALNIEGDSSGASFGDVTEYGGVETEALQETLDPAQALRNAEMNSRIAELESIIAQHEDQLKEMISSPDAATNSSFVEQAEFRTIAQELPALQAELKALKAQQTQP